MFTPIQKLSQICEQILSWLPRIERDVISYLLAQRSILVDVGERLLEGLATATKSVKVLPRLLSTDKLLVPYFHSKFPSYSYFLVAERGVHDEQEGDEHPARRHLRGLS